MASQASAKLIKLSLLCTKAKSVSTVLQIIVIKLENVAK